MSALLLALTVLQGPLDEGTFIVREDTAEIARETFRLSAARPSGGAGAAGWILASTVHYDRSRPAMVLAPILEVGADSLPLSLQYDVADPRRPARILGQLSRGRFTVRLLGRTTERAREFPAGAETVVLDDSVYALYTFAAWRARPGGAGLSAIFPRAGRRETLTARDLGVQPTTLNRDPVSLRHVTVSGGANGLVHLWLDAEERLLKVEVPSRRLTVERQPAA